MTLDNKLLIGSILSLCTFTSWLVIACNLVNIGEWSKYYKTILFFSLCSAIYDLIFVCNYPLWQYRNFFLGHTFVELLTLIIVFPCTTVIFLHYYPKKLYKQIIYILIWATLYTGMEIPFYSLHALVYYNNWNIGWSMIHNLYQFPLLILHERKPILAWITSFIILGIMMYIFNFPLRSVL